MGGVVRARCSSCGYERRLALGAGRMSFLTYNAVPVLCHLCRQLTSPNAKAEALACTACGCEAVTRYDVPGDKAGARQPIATSWWSVGGSWVLPVGPHRCPRCDTPELRFREVALWD